MAFKNISNQVNFPELECEVLDFWRKSGGDFDMLLLTENGHIYITPGLEDCFELSSGYEGVYTVEVVH